MRKEGWGMTTEERSRLESLDAVLRSQNVRKQIRPIVERVRAELARKKAALMTWESIPLTIFGSPLPAQIRSAWVFVLRAGADTGVEQIGRASCRERGEVWGGGGLLERIDH